MDLLLIPAITAGLVGTLVKTALMAVAPTVGMPKMDVVGMLGSMLTPDEGAMRNLGIAVHLVMGIVFALIYAFLWSQGVTIGEGWAINGLVYGLVHGLLAILGMPMLMKMHPRPPTMPGGFKSLLGMLVGHVVFGLVVAALYTWLGGALS